MVPNFGTSSHPIRIAIYSGFPQLGPSYIEVSQNGGFPHKSSKISKLDHFSLETHDLKVLHFGKPPIFQDKREDAALHLASQALEWSFLTCTLAVPLLRPGQHPIVGTNGCPNYPNMLWQQDLMIYITTLSCSPKRRAFSRSTGAKKGAWNARLCVECPVHRRGVSNPSPLGEGINLRWEMEVV